jgi:predicted membrane chloride channel (bestrophin family)
MVSISLLGIEASSTEIEDPFGTDKNDLPLEILCKAIHDNAKWFAEHSDFSTLAEVSEIELASIADDKESRIDVSSPGNVDQMEQE